MRPPGSTVTTETVNYSFGDQLPSNDTDGFSEAYQATLGARFEIVGDWQLEALFSYGHDEEESISVYGIDNAALNAALARTDPATALNPFSPQPNNAAALATRACDTGTTSPSQSVSPHRSAMSHRHPTSGSHARAGT